MRAKSENRYVLIIKLLVLLTLLSILLFGNTQTKSSMSILIKDGLIYNFGQDHPYTGQVIDTLDQTIIEYNVVEGLKNGEFNLFALSGKPMINGLIKNNKNEGKWTYFYGNGKVESEGSFKNDKPHGKWTWYHPDGMVKSEGYYINGKQQGKWQNFDDTGGLIKVTHYDLGRKTSEVNLRKTKSV
jgi:antitoxin component YwqK of YwqJK toxin-antitoxin module